MKVYKPGQRSRSVTTIAPGVKYPTSEFLDTSGKPLQIPVEFIWGVADVSDEIGRYMLDEGLAERSPIILAA